jgi:SAM-dependent methyltransferase
MSHEDWEQRYQKGDTHWDKGAPAPGLVDFLKANPNLPRGSVVVPGCGSGHDVRAFAQAGFVATGIDFAPSAIEWAERSTKGTGLNASFRRLDFLRETPPEQFDWLFEHTLFCAIQPAERDEYVRAVQRWLRPGGCYLAVHYNIPDTDGPPFGTNEAELDARFGPPFERLFRWIPRSYPNRVGLELMTWYRLRP